jgi:hypothetical protein
VVRAAAARPSSHLVSGAADVSAGSGMLCVLVCLYLCVCVYFCEVESERVPVQLLPDQAHTLIAVLLTSVLALVRCVCLCVCVCVCACPSVK